MIERRRTLNEQVKMRLIDFLLIEKKPTYHSSNHPQSFSSISKFIVAQILSEFRASLILTLGFSIVSFPFAMVRNAYLFIIITFHDVYCVCSSCQVHWCVPWLLLLWFIITFFLFSRCFTWTMAHRLCCVALRTQNIYYMWTLYLSHDV